ncbi:thiamine diphosphokinase [Natranaerobius thermophilus]|uniref:Thiamine diphosphokinase n=1 Tax=Natranaerobius thermophilus (strain ATCC BAA-1301 / DSM 18059 / JW/NM-WN-LF) TaxID=457570 RepID=B2A6U1_NATTJ|nr:thiamine diphosphokinase [Natranaerobius thermophilus]ACB84222.1 thiamine pyrophosphokinase [Natranaerobius thermophilus JW/NM-WN-LF]
MVSGKINRVAIFANGDYDNPQFYCEELEKSDYIIAVDGGANFLYKVDETPDLLLGDMDSITAEAYQYYSRLDIPIKHHPAEKDESDLELALVTGINLKPKEIFVYGAFGNRVDHLFANIMVMLNPIKNGIYTCLKDTCHEITITDSKLTLIGNPGDYLSLFALTQEVSGIYAHGVKYPLENDSLTMGPSRGLSNEFITEQVDIAIKTGYLLAIKVNTKF